MKLYAQDAVLMPQHSLPAEGRDVVRTAYRHVFDTIRLNIDFTVDEIGVLSAVNFHHQFADQIRMIMLLKSVSMAGGFLLLAAAGPGPFSLDTRFARA